MKIPYLTAKAVRQANQKVYNRKTVEAYESNPSIFEHSRQQAIRNILSKLLTPGSQLFLDIGCGTGNILRIARDYFRVVIGVDIATELLKKTKQCYPDLTFIAADAARLPFLSSTFDVVSLYGTLHHFYDTKPILRAIYSLLKPNGFLYTDHDPNYFFQRFYQFYYRHRWRHQPGFGSIEEEIAEYAHTQQAGINPEQLSRELLKIGFREVKIYYRHTSNPNLSLIEKIGLSFLKILSSIIPWKSFYTHFYLIAQK